MSYQKPPHPIDISNWLFDDEYDGIYPKGARDKKTIISPQTKQHDCLISNYRYLFKKSSHRYPDQFWVEIIAYRLGCLMNISVPPSFVAIDHNGQVGSLIEWFYNDRDKSFSEYIEGGDLIMGFIPDFDRKKGLKHNLCTIIEIMSKLVNDQAMSFSEDWKQYWAKVLIFDSVIGNTDRHQDNWGICIYKKHSEKALIIFSPVFDNGTSMGHEILEQNILQFEEYEKMKKYVQKGTHHMKWELKDKLRINHIDFICKFFKEFPETRPTILNSLHFDLNHFKIILNEMTMFEVPVNLTYNRASFIFNLIKYRKELILNRIGV